MPVQFRADDGQAALSDVPQPIHHPLLCLQFLPLLFYAPLTLPEPLQTLLVLLKLLVELLTLAIQPLRLLLAPLLPMCQLAFALLIGQLASLAFPRPALPVPCHPGQLLPPTLGLALALLLLQGTLGDPWLPGVRQEEEQEATHLVAAVLDSDQRLIKEYLTHEYLEVRIVCGMHCSQNGSGSRRESW